jgi:glutamine cyclotransferase
MESGSPGEKPSSTIAMLSRKTTLIARPLSVCSLSTFMLTCVFPCSESLAYNGGVLYESVGMHGKSEIRVLDKVTGKTIQSQTLAKRFHAKGLAIVDNTAIQLMYKHKIAFIYNTEDITAAPRQIEFESTTGEGWGLTYSRGLKLLYLSDKSEYLHILDPETLKLKKKVEIVRQNDKKSDGITDLEWWHGKILACVYNEDVILVINPLTGVVEKEYGT